MKKNFSTAGIIVGIATIVLGLFLAFGFHVDYYGVSTSSYSFGADFYTEQYAATEHAADNILALGNYLEKVIAFVFKAAGLIVAVFGGAITCYFGCKLADAKNPVIPPAPIIVKQETPAEAAEELPEI